MDAGFGRDRALCPVGRDGRSAGDFRTNIRPQGRLYGDLGPFGKGAGVIFDAGVAGVRRGGGRAGISGALDHAACEPADRSKMAGGGRRPEGHGGVPLQGASERNLIGAGADRGLETRLRRHMRHQQMVRPWRQGWGVGRADSQVRDAGQDRLDGLRAASRSDFLGHLLRAEMATGVGRGKGAERGCGGTGWNMALRIRESKARVMRERMRGIDPEPGTVT